jgi:NAD(P)-dependent dehydrogenase (short-subunit alcohol dehydrogenase family)
MSGPTASGQICGFSDAGSYCPQGIGIRNGSDYVLLALPHKLATVSSTPKNETVLLIGASRGLGYAIAARYIERGARVVATVRGTGRTALHDLQDAAGGRLEIEQVDIDLPEQVQALRDQLGSRRFDLVFVVAGVTHRLEETAATITTEEFTRVMLTNALSPMRVIESLGPLTEPDGTIALMSSGQGSVANNRGGGWEIYRASKAALNQLMRSYAGRHHDDNRTLLLMAPGWVKTEMGGSDARLEISESIPSLVTTVDAQRGRPGLQYLDYKGQTVAW